MDLLKAITIGILFFGSIALAAYEMSYLAYIHNSGYLLAALIIPAVIMAYHSYKSIKKEEEGPIVVQTTVIAFAFFLLVFEAGGMFLNRISSFNCEAKQGEIVVYQPQYVSAYGRMKSETQANRFAITIEFDDQSKQEYVLKQNWFLHDPTGIQFEFTVCKSIFGIPMLKTISEDNLQIKLY